MSTGAWARGRGLRRHTEAGGTRLLEAGAQPLELATPPAAVPGPWSWGTLQAGRAPVPEAGWRGRAAGPSAQVIELGAPTGLRPNGFRLCSDPPRDLGGSKSSWGGYRVAKFCFYRICFSSAFI